MNSDLVVVGAGIVGASVAYHAARAGAVLTLVDVGRPGAVTAGRAFVALPNPCLGRAERRSDKRMTGSSV